MATFDLHWLPVQLRIEFKSLLLKYRAVNGLAPSYLTELVFLYASTTRTGLRSADKRFWLSQKHLIRLWGNRAFSASAPYLWNSLPIEIRSCSSVCSFKSMLKTHLMHTDYGHNQIHILLYTVVLFGFLDALHDCVAFVFLLCSCKRHMCFRADLCAVHYYYYYLFQSQMQVG